MTPDKSGTPERRDPRSGPGDPIGSNAPAAPATGSADRAFTELAPGEEPVATGTLFLTVIILMIIAAFWAIIYMRLIDR